MDSLLQDIRYTLRALWKAPGFTLVAVLTIGLAIGANTTVFTLIENLVLRPLPGVPPSDRLLAVHLGDQGGRAGGFGYDDYRDWREGARSLDGLAASGDGFELALRADGPAQHAWGDVVSANLFAVLGVRPVVGRTFRPDDEAGAAPVAVISYGLWQRTFRGDRGVVGRHVLLNGSDFTIIGVAPAGFAGASTGMRHDVWVPVTLYEQVTPSSGALAVRGWRFLQTGIARLKPGVTLEQARTDLNTLHRGLAAVHPELRNTTVVVERLSAAGLAGMLAPVMGALLGVTILVLLVACANLANLLVARATGRRREIGIRLAVGAGRPRLTRQLLTESMVLALGGGLVGLLVATWGKAAVLSLVPVTGLPLGFDLSFDARVLGAAAGVTLATALAFGLAPALRASKVEVAGALRSGNGGPGRTRLQSALVVAQVALSLVALVVAGLFVRGLQRAATVATGIRQPEQVLLADVNLYTAGYADSAARQVVDGLLEEVRAVPGVRSAAVATQLPLGFGGFANISVELDGVPSRPEEPRMALMSLVSAGYFETAGVPIVRGRGITKEDRPGGQLVVVVNEEFARRNWPGQDPIGKQLHFGGNTGPWYVVVGVCGDVKGDRLDRPAPPAFYRSIHGRRPDGFTLHLRAAGDPRALQQAVRRAAERIYPDLPLTNLRTMAEHMGAATAVQRVGAGASSAFGLLALVLAAVGLFGVLSYSVAQRTREMGVRLAVGASPRDVRRLVVGRALRLGAIGVAAGLPLAVGAGLLLRGLIFGVSPFDPMTFGRVVALVAGVALVAAWLPARRAARVDPIIALQAE